MANVKKWNVVLMLLLTLIAAVVQVSLKYEAYNGTNTDMFPKSLKKVTQEHKLLITPSDGVFSAWAVIFTWQFLLILFNFYSLLRNNAEANITGPKFYIVYIFHIFFDIGATVSWSKGHLIESLILVGFRTVFIGGAFGRACYEFYQYRTGVMAYHCKNSEFINLTDIEKSNIGPRGVFEKWWHRVVVQNGTLFYTGWSSLDSLYHLAMVLKEDIQLTDEIASVIGLSLTTSVMICWFLIEYLFVQRYSPYTFAAYLAVVYGVSGIFHNIMFENKTIGIFSLILLLLASFLFVVRLLIICLRRRSQKIPK